MICSDQSSPCTSSTNCIALKNCLQFT